MKPTRAELIRDNGWLFSQFKRNNLLDKYCLPPAKRRTIKDAIKVFKKIYGNKKIGRGELRESYNWIYQHFKNHNLLDEHCLHGKLKTFQDAKKNFKKFYGDKKPKRYTLKKEHHWIYAQLARRKLLDKYCLPRLR